jgi:hypothetical protein
MNNTRPRTETQFSVVLVNKPGVLSRVVQHIARHKINIVALSMMDSTEHGVLRLVVEDPDRARSCLAGLELPRSEQNVLVMVLPNRPGALADVVERLAAEHVNVHYAYCTTGARGGRTLGVFKVDNLGRAMQLLEERKPRRREAATVRSNGRARR